MPLDNLFQMDPIQSLTFAFQSFFDQLEIHACHPEDALGT